MLSYFKIAFIAAVTLYIQAASAVGIGLNATRIIYPEKERSVTIGIRNTSPDTVYLLQAKVLHDADGGEQRQFHPSPAIFRMEPSSQHKVRITGDTGMLPKDRESVFYFRATAIPSSHPKGITDELGTAGIKISLASTIKLFYRPTDLGMTPQQAWRGLQVLPSSKGVILKNNSPYHVSFSAITVNGKPVSLKEGQLAMLAPFSESIYRSKERSGEVRWTVINDLGGNESYQARLG